MMSLKKKVSRDILEEDFSYPFNVNFYNVRFERYALSNTAFHLVYWVCNWHSIIHSFML